MSSRLALPGRIRAAESSAVTRLIPPGEIVRHIRGDFAGEFWQALLHERLNSLLSVGTATTCADAAALDPMGLHRMGHTQAAPSQLAHEREVGSASCRET